MTFPDKYRCIPELMTTNEEFNIVPIRYEDRFLIMKWRNEQLYHLRQTAPLTEADQEYYFTNVVSDLFDQELPNQLLFSLIEGKKCIGYGGLVHINWKDKNAELSFIMDTAREHKEFEKLWSIYLDLIEKIAFDQLKFHKLYTYAFDIRPHLYPALEKKFYRKEAVLKEHCLINGEFKDVVIHSKIDYDIQIRRVVSDDKDITYQWATDKVTRENSFNTGAIDYATHSAWFDRKLESEWAVYYICEVSGIRAGLVRFDLSESDATIGILIDEDFRGRGLAPLFIKKCCTEFREYFQVPIFAYIKEENKASVASFVKADFALKENILINNFESLKYEYGR